MWVHCGMNAKGPPCKQKFFPERDPFMKSALIAAVALILALVFAPGAFASHGHKVRNAHLITHHRHIYLHHRMRHNHVRVHHRHNEGPDGASPEVSERSDFRIAPD